VTPRVSTGIAKLDAMLDGGLLPGTLTVVYGATGIGKTHVGLTFADRGRLADGARGIVLDLNGRGDSQQHDEYAARLFKWSLTPWTHSVTPMTDPYPPPEQMQASYSNTLKWVGRVRDFQVPTPDGGTHDTGLRAAIVKAIRNYISTHKLDPKGVTLTAEDIREGVVAVLSTYVHDPQFQSQTKNRLNNPEVAAQVEALVRLAPTRPEAAGTRRRRSRPIPLAESWIRD